MAKTYLEIVNIVLRDLNEVPLTIGSFNNAVGLQAFVKEAVNRALLDIINYNDEWPWLANAPLNPGNDSTTHTFNTVDGVREYALPAGIDNVDYDNVFVIDPDSQEMLPRRLTLIDYDEAINLTVIENSDPIYVYKSPNNNYMGLLPKPNKVYAIEYTAWKEPSLLVNDYDTLPFPDRYYTVLVSRARYYAWMFRENAQQASISYNEYEDNLKRMFNNLMLPEARVMRAV